MAKDKSLKTGKMSLLGIIITGFIIGILLFATTYVLYGWFEAHNSAHPHLRVDVSRINDSFICVETIVGFDFGSELLNSTAPGWGCYNVSTNDSEVSNYVDTGGDICSSKAGSRQYFKVPLNTTIVVQGNFQDNKSLVTWTGVI
jgi:hypothetical protein